MPIFNTDLLPQGTSHGCWAACLRMLYRYFNTTEGMKTDLANLTSNFGKSAFFIGLKYLKPDNTNNILQTLNSYNFFTYKQLKQKVPEQSAFNLNEMKMLFSESKGPIMAAGKDHWIVIDGYDDDDNDKFKINDPYPNITGKKYFYNWDELRNWISWGYDETFIFYRPFATNTPRSRKRVKKWQCLANVV